jgi:hypothetical protein
VFENGVVVPPLVFGGHDFSLILVCVLARK